MLIAKETCWLLTASGIALGAVLDMRRLRINRIGGIGPRGWAVACLCVGPLAGALYLTLRRLASRQLADFVWRAIGDASHPATARRARLAALHRHGLVGGPVFRACQRVLDAEDRSR